MSETCDICGRPVGDERDSSESHCDRAYWAEADTEVMGWKAGLGYTIDCYTLGLARLRAERDALRAELSRLTTWHPASEPPDTDRDVLVLRGDKVVVTGSYEMEHWFARGTGNAYPLEPTVTNWRELPPDQEATP